MGVQLEDATALESGAAMLIHAIIAMFFGHSVGQILFLSLFYSQHI